MIRMGVLAAVLSAGLMLVACGESSKPSFDGLVPDGAPHLDQASLKFVPNNITVDVGEKVYFTNSETAMHKVEVDGEAITGDMRRGDVAAFTFETAGEFQLTCPYHPQMKATVVVE